MYVKYKNYQASPKCLGKYNYGATCYLISSINLTVCDFYCFCLNMNTDFLVADFKCIDILSEYRNSSNFQTFVINVPI